MSEGWLKCEVLPGMFSTEVVVVVRIRDGREFKFFVPRDAVSEGKVRVRVTNGGTFFWATLPTDYPNSAVPVREEDLVEA